MSHTALHQIIIVHNFWRRNLAASSDFRLSTRPPCLVTTLVAMVSDTSIQHSRFVGSLFCPMISQTSLLSKPKSSSRKRKAIAKAGCPPPLSVSSVVRSKIQRVVASVLEVHRTETSKRNGTWFVLYDLHKPAVAVISIRVCVLSRRRSHCPDD